VQLLKDRLMTWIVGSRWGIPIAVLVASAIAAGGKLLAASLLLHDPWRHEGLIGVDTSISAILTGSLVWVLLTAVRDRRRRLIDYVRRVAELNHQVRNALQVIVYQAAIEEKAPESSALLTSAVRRVDAALNEIFPILGDRESDVHRIVR
jgi:hypothetical protein